MLTLSRNIRRTRCTSSGWLSWTSVTMREFWEFGLEIAAAEREDRIG